MFRRNKKHPNPKIQSKKTRADYMNLRGAAFGGRRATGSVYVMTYYDKPICLKPIKASTGLDESISNYRLNKPHTALNTRLPLPNDQNFLNKYQRGYDYYCY